MNILDSLCAVEGISSAGVCEFDALTPYFAPGARDKALALCPGAARVVVALFPYYAGNAPGNLALYARGADYHAVVQRLLAPFAERLADGVVLADASPLPETQAARLAGVGKLGENGLIFDPLYGSYVVIGTILTTQPLPLEAARHSSGSPTSPPAPGDRLLQCNHCGACRRACPLDALGKDGSVNPDRCLSALTQKNGPLAPWQTAALAQHPLIWGCDLCQTSCPLNRHVPETGNPAFREVLVCSLSRDALDGLTRRQFTEKFPLRAFTWRGPAPLLRNLTCKELPK